MREKGTSALGSVEAGARAFAHPLRCRASAYDSVGLITRQSKPAGRGRPPGRPQAATSLDYVEKVLTAGSNQLRMRLYNRVYAMGLYKVMHPGAQTQGPVMSLNEGDRRDSACT